MANASHAATWGDSNCRSGEAKAWLTTRRMTAKMAREGDGECAARLGMDNRYDWVDEGLYSRALRSNGAWAGRSGVGDSIGWSRPIRLRTC